MHAKKKQPHSEQQSNQAPSASPRRSEESPSSGVNTTQQAPPTGNAVPPDKTAGSNAVNSQSRPDGLVGGCTQVLGKVKWAFGNWLPPPRPIASHALNLNQTDASPSPSPSLVNTHSGKEKIVKAWEGDWNLAKRNRPLPTPVPAPPRQSTISTQSGPYPAQRYARNMGHVNEKPYQTPLQANNTHGILRSSEVATGDIINMELDLRSLGFHKDNEKRYFIVLGETDSGSFVVLPISSYGGRGKDRFSRENEYWKQDYFKSMKSAISRQPDKNEDLIDDWDEDAGVIEDDGSLDDDDVPDTWRSITPHQPIFCQNFRCEDGTVVALANAFVVKFDQSNTIPACKAGFLTPQGCKDMLHCHEHLLDDHPEVDYLLGIDADDWEYKVAQSTINHEPCRDNLMFSRLQAQVIISQALLNPTNTKMP